MESGGRRSQAFCIDSSGSLTSQYLIRDHMVFHYNSILSAKVADQQRREKLRKKIARCEEKMSVCETISRSSSRGSGRLLPSSFGKSFLEAEDRGGLCPCARQAQYLSRAMSPYGEHDFIHSSAVKYGCKCSQNISRASRSDSNISTRPPRNSFGLSCSRSMDSFVSMSHAQRCQESNSKECPGDLLEKHSKYFTKSRKPFTPRTLISNAKSFLSQYRYYYPPRRKKKNPRKQHVETQTQTDIVRFSSVDNVSGRKVTVEQQKIALKAEDKRNTVDEPDRGIDACPYSILREEELSYLTFLEDVTNEILSLGLFSNRVLEELFECHIEENKNRLDEAKMRQMLDVLKRDLGCSLDSEEEQIHSGSEASDSLDLQDFDTIEELEFTSKGHRLRKATKSEEFFGTMDSSLKQPNKCESPLCSVMSKITQSIEDFSEMMDAGSESDSSVTPEEHTDTSHTCEASLNLIADSDLEVRKALDDLEETFAEALQLSHDYVQ
ncbi:spermatogenesis associated 7 [Willisornis vidua]|uniref:Spermatogenesis associated 7 n=1 Tax=Willisornis vidua TaxID=1566151 RepID=A0ABQ9CMA9_9PASS|nr:spermatogenesis associated 7 [Willisornis vidua]